MSPGRVIAVVGPSGVGKDSVIGGLAAALPEFAIPRRAVTRPPEPGGENHIALGEAEFAERLARGAFCLHWHAHGLSYGIQREVAERAAAGQSVLLNLSRSVLAEADCLFARLTVLRLSASAPTLAARLAGRNRETAPQIAGRLARESAALPAHLHVIDIRNDGTLAETIAAARAALQPLRA